MARSYAKKPANWKRLRQWIWVRDRGQCQVCGKRLKWEEYICGHKVDRSMGGCYIESNLMVMCSRCDRSKPKHQTMTEFEAWRETMVILEMMRVAGLLK